MYTSPGILAILIFSSLHSITLAAPHNEDAPPPANKSTRTVVITLTRPIDPPSSTSRIPNKPESLPAPLNPTLKPTFQTRTRKPLAVTCPDPTEACIMDGIAIWPSRALPSFTLDTSDAAFTKAPHTVSPASLCSTHKHPHARSSDFTVLTASTSTSKLKAELSSPAPGPNTAYPTPPLPALNPPTIQDPARAKVLGGQGESERGSGSIRRSTWGNSTVRAEGAESVGLDPVAWAGQGYTQGE